MQPLIGPGPSSGDRTNLNLQTGQSQAGNQPLSTAQRTTLERLIIRIMSLSPLKSAELWAGLRREVGVGNDSELLSRHFPAAEQFLMTRLTDVQETRATRQMIQRLTQLLPQGNNRQAVSDFIRQQFGHTVLSALSQQQLSQVITMLEQGQITIPQPQQNHITDRSLLPAEHQALNQQIVKLAATSDESPNQILSTVLKLVNLKSGDPIPSRYFPLLTHYIQARQTLSEHSAPTLHALAASLKQPPDNHEHRLLETYSEQNFHASPQTTLTAVQAQDLLNQLFIYRATKDPEQLLASNQIHPKPITPLWTDILPNALKPLVPRNGTTAVLAVIILAGLLWLLL